MREDDLHQALRDLGIVWTTMEHDPVFTVADSEAIHAAMPGAHTKNLFLKDASGRYWLVTTDHARRVDLKALAAAIGSRKLSFGKAEEMEGLLRVSPGAVTPLAVLAADPGVTVVIDADLATAAAVNVHPLRNTATIGLAGADLVRALVAWDHPPVIATIPERP